MRNQSSRKRVKCLMVALTFIMISLYTNTSSANALRVDDVHTVLMSSSKSRSAPLELSRRRYGNYLWYLAIAAKRAFCAATNLCRPVRCVELIDAKVRATLVAVIERVQAGNVTRQFLAKSLYNSLIKWDSSADAKFWDVPLPDRETLKSEIILLAAAVFYLFPDGSQDKWIVAVEERMACEF